MLSSLMQDHVVEIFQQLRSQCSSIQRSRLPDEQFFINLRCCVRPIDSPDSAKQAFEPIGEKLELVVRLMFQLYRPRNILWQPTMKIIDPCVPLKISGVPDPLLATIALLRLDFKGERQYEYAKQMVLAIDELRILFSEERSFLYWEDRRWLQDGALGLYGKTVHTANFYFLLKKIDRMLHCKWVFAKIAQEEYNPSVIEQFAARQSIAAASASSSCGPTASAAFSSASYLAQTSLNTLKRSGSSADLKDSAESPPPLKKTRGKTPPDTSALPLLAPIPQRETNIAAVLGEGMEAAQLESQIELVIDQLAEPTSTESPQIPKLLHRSTSGELLL